MKFILGLLVGLILAVGIAAAGAYFAFGDLRDIDFGDRDRSEDVTETLDLAGFNAIEVGGVFELEVTVGGDFSVVLTGDADEMERVEAKVENGELVLDQRRPDRGKRRWRNQGVTATISLPSLTDIDVSGVVDGEVTGVDAESFSADFSGVGDLDLEGTCGTLKARLSGIGDLDARDLQCAIADVDVSGIGEASVYASEEVDASVSGIGSISIYGSPAKVDKDSSFLADISVK